jgi:multiple sugar transport system permease protein
MKKARLEKSYWGYIFIFPFFIAYALFATYPLISTFQNSVTDRRTFEHRGLSTVVASVIQDNDGNDVVSIGGTHYEIFTDSEGDYIMLAMVVPGRADRRAELITDDEGVVTAVAYQGGEDFIGLRNYYHSHFIEMESTPHIPLIPVEGQENTVRIGPQTRLTIQEDEDGEYVTLVAPGNVTRRRDLRLAVNHGYNEDGEAIIYGTSPNAIFFLGNVHEIFTDFDKGGEYIAIRGGGDDNSRDIIRDPDGSIRVGSLQVTGVFGVSRYRDAFFNTPLVWFMGFVPQILLALLLAAWFTDARLKARGQTFFKTVFYMPNMMTAATISALFFGFITTGGIIHQLAVSTGFLESAADPITGLWFTRGLIAFINTWMWFGNTMIIMIAGINSISLSLFEAARIDGAGSRRIFWYITVPMIKPILTFTFVQSLVGGLQMFDIPELLSTPVDTNLDRGATTTIMTSINQVAYGTSNNMGLATAMSVVLFLITVLFSIVIFLLMRDRSDEKWLKAQKKLAKAQENIQGKGGALR